MFVCVMIYYLKCLFNYVSKLMNNASNENLMMMKLLNEKYGNLSGRAAQLAEYVTKAMKITDIKDYSNLEDKIKQFKKKINDIKSNKIIRHFEMK